MSACNRCQQWAIPDQLLFAANTKHLYNICTTSAQRLQYGSNIVQMLYKCFVFTVLNAAQQTRGVEPVLVRCWASVSDDGPALVHHWVNIVFSGCVDKCFVPKRNNKFRLIHISTVHRNNLITLITKAIDTTSMSYQPLWLCYWRGDISIFLFTKIETFLVFIWNPRVYLHRAQCVASPNTHCKHNCISTRR